MIIIYILLIGVGALPLIFFLINRKNYRYIMANGTRIQAQVTDVKTLYLQKGNAYDRVYFAYLPVGSFSYKSCIYKFKIGTYRRGDRFDIFYLPEKPDKYAIPGNNKWEVPVLLFMILIFLFTIYAAYKIHELVGNSNISFKF